MFRITSQSGHTAYGLKYYVCDLTSDIDLLDITDTPGSEAYCIDNGTTYILSNSHEWKVKTSNNPADDAQIEELVAIIEALNKEIEELKQEIEELRKNEEEAVIVEKTLSIPANIGSINTKTHTLTLNSDKFSVQGNTLKITGGNI